MKNKIREMLLSIPMAVILYYKWIAAAAVVALLVYIAVK